MMNTKSSKELQKWYPAFVYKGYKWILKGKDLAVEYTFSVSEKITFHPRLKFKNVSKENILSLKKETMDNLVFNLGLAEIPSYWKATLSPQIIIEAESLDKYQINWWTKLLEKGMGQFYFENNIDWVTRKLFSIAARPGKVAEKIAETTGNDLLISVGGGKDSAVTLEILKKNYEIGAFVINPTRASLAVIKKAGVKKTVIVERVIDPQLLKLNSQGFLNGHTPFSSLVAFLGVFSAVIYGYKEVVLSNERSSDEENTVYLGKKINHQYSKTLEFENKFREYNLEYLSDVNYFSFLRPLYEIQISKIFSTMNKYFSLIRSCNASQKTNEWCGNCPKCLSTYILLKPFLKGGDLKRIFPEDLTKKEELRPVLESLVSKDKIKPFECVGTKEELQRALNNSHGDILKSWGPSNLSNKYEKILKKVL